MSRVFLKATCATATPATFTRTVTEYDTVTRTETTTTSNELACQVYELAVGTLVDSWCELDGTHVAVYYKAGDSYNPLNGLTGQTIVLNHPNCPLPGTLTLGTVSADPATTPNAADGVIHVAYFTPHPPVTGVVAGQVQTNAAGSGTLGFAGLPGGTYPITVEDAAQQQAHSSVVVGVVAGTGVVRLWLRYTIMEEQQDNPQDPGHPIVRNLLQGSYWDPLAKAVVALALDVTGDYDYPSPPAAYARPITLQVDAYYLSGGVVYRQVFHRDDDGDGVGDGDVRFVDTSSTTLPTVTGLQLDNIIIQHVHRVATGAQGPAVGGVLLEAHSSVEGSLTYTRVATGQATATGAFADLPAGPHLFRIQDTAGNTLETTVTIEDRYRLRWFVASYAPDGAPVRVDILGRDYDGASPTQLDTAGPEGLERSWDAAGQDLEGVLPEAQGQACRVTVRQQFAGQFADLFLGDDRAFRFDVRVRGVLVFRGYNAPDLYDEDLSKLTGGEITFTAGDGLGSLRNTAFLNHEALPLSGRWPMLHTLLHCLSRCEAGPLPLYVQTDLTEASQPAGTDWLPTFFTDRAGYAATDDEAKAWTCREVIEAILRPAHAVLVQREGAWWVVSANAAGTDAAFFTYAPNGEPLPTPFVPAALLLKPATFTTGNLNWVEAAQRAQTLAGARAVVVNTKLLLVKNHLADGTLQLWQPDLQHPVGWTGTLQVERFDTVAGEDAKPLAGLTKLRTGTTQPLGAFLASPAIPFRTNANETPVRVALRLRVRPAPDGTARTATIQVRPMLSGVAFPVLRWEVGSQEKEVTVEGFVAFGFGMLTLPLHLELLTPTYVIPFGLAPAAVDFYEVTLQILPGAVEWPDADQITAENETGFLVLPAVDLHHADTPRLPLSDGTLRPVPTMDAFAWRHVLTYGDGTPTTAWCRTESLAAAPLLETAGLDRLNLRRTPVSVFTGPVHGAKVHALGFGAVVDCPQDAPGVRFWCVGATVRDLEGAGEVTLREIGLADAEPLPLNRIVTHTGAAIFTDEGFCLAYGTAVG